MQVVIAFAGRKGHGKDYCAHIVSEKYGAKRVSFADPIKEMAGNVFFWDGNKDKKGRKFLQLLGTEVGRCYNERIWIDKALDKMRKHDMVVNTDLRFNHEAEALEELDRKVVVIRVEKLDGWRMKWDKFKWVFKCKLGLEHSSEKGIDEKYIDYVVYNDFRAPEKTIETVNKIVEDILND